MFKTLNGETPDKVLSTKFIFRNDTSYQARIQGFEMGGEFL